MRMVGIAKKSKGRRQSRQQRRVEKTRDKLFAAARSVFSERGLGASVGEITERADVARGSFYYHFKSKDRLIRQMVDDILKELIERMITECSERKGLDQMLDGIIQAHIGFFSTRWKDFVLYYQGRADLTLDESFEGLEKPFVKYGKSIERLIDASIPEPISNERLRRTANAIAGFISGYYSFASIASADQNIDKEFESLRKAFITSLARFAREALPESQVKW
jgi:AcrR family transcriptional regulator